MASKIKRITVQNVKTISDCNLDLNGSTAIVTAGNNKGKTSLLRSLMDRMRSIKPERILRQGEKDGFYEMELTTGEKFRWQFEDKPSGLKEKLIFITEKNIPASLTKEISSFYFPKVFDVDSFLEQTPALKKKQLEKIAGIDFTEIDRLIKEARENRAYLNKKVAEDYAKLGTYDPKLGLTPDPTIESVRTELAMVSTHNEKIKGFKLRLTEKESSLSKCKQRISVLKKELEEAEQEAMQLETDIDKGNNILKDEKWQPKDESFVNDLNLKIGALVKKNKSIEENQKAFEQQKTYDKTVENQKIAENEVKKLEESKTDSIKNASSLPEGFGFSDEGITYNGFEFTKEQLSQSKIYIAALKLATLGLGEVRSIHFDAAALDKNSLQEILSWANENDLQLLIERPDYEGGEIEYQIIEN
jgi:hypothetical protein